MNATEDSIVESLAAYCLAMTSSSDDAIHHFHQVRLNVIVNQLALSRGNIPKALRLFGCTLQTSKVLRSRQFSDVLSKLKSRPILSDPEIRALDGLEIEVLGRWAVPGVKNFTPWIKLSEMSRSEGVGSIKEWSLQAFDKVAEGCQKSLAHSNDFTELLSLRADTVELWLSSWGSTITHRSVDVLERLRNIFNDHLKRILIAQVQNIDEVADQISSAISTWDTTEHEAVGSLWDPDLTNADFSNGAGAFKQTVADRLLGRDKDVSTVLQNYKAWLASIQETNESIDSLRRLKWTDILVGGEVEDEDVDINPQLNEDDPSFLSDALHSAVRQALDGLNSSVGDVFKTFGPSHASQKAVFLLRVIRLVRRDIPTHFLAKDFTFSSEVVPKLQELLAAEIVAQNGSLSLIPSFKSHPETGKPKVVPGRTLWEGEPPVPVQPSPGTFKYLRRLTATMDENGSDLWDPSTVKVLKEALQRHLENALGSALEELEAWKPENKDAKPAQNGEEKGNDSSTETETETAEPNSPSPSHTELLRDWKVQLFFDTMYLANMLGDTTQLAGVADRVQKSAAPSAEAVKAVRKFALEYWKRTEMLFGLLAER
jgi:DNA-binding protein YbaB